jgi:hypothetical protein
MSENETRLREILAQIAELASAASSDGAEPGEDEYGEGADQAPAQAPDKDARACTPKSLPKRLRVKAAETAVRINPVNAPMRAPASGEMAALVNDPQRIAVLTSKYWGPTPRRLTVSFMETAPADLRRRILGHMNAWGSTSCIQFVETQGTGNVRISRSADGYWSYLGTDILHIPRNRQTMNLQGFTMSTPESEYKRVVRHETGHTLGFPHEHMRRALVARIDPNKAYAFFLRTQGWNRQTVDEQVLTPLDESSIMATPADQSSIMCYPLPASITRDGRAITGGLDINRTDFTFAGRIYPKPGREAQMETEEVEPEDDEGFDDEDYDDDGTDAG